jgi:hypothetical protein
MDVAWLCLLVLWSLVCLVLLRRLLARNPVLLWRGLAFAPTEPVSSQQLATYLLSANLALLADDDFNQLKSALSKRRARGMLRRRWQIRSLQDFERTVADRLRWCGTGTPEEMRALAAWRDGRSQPSAAYASLDGICKFLSVHVGIVDERGIGACHLNLAAWDVQQLACIVRLGAALDYLPRAGAQALLTMLHQEARRHYTSWSDYSLSALIGMGMRSPVDLHASARWHRIASSHAALLRTPTSPMARAGLWSTAPSSAAPVHAMPPRQAGPLSTSFDTLH